MIQKTRNTLYNKKGFTLIELMIVIAIIGILAAIAVPQFLAYRMRSYNTAAKAMANNVKADNSNLNSELGTFGASDPNILINLNAPDPCGPGGCAGGVIYTAPASANPQGTAAAPGIAGIRIAGTTTDGARVMAVGVSVGPLMHIICSHWNDANDNASATNGARHERGDTAYAVDTDVENVLFSVSNPDAWPNLAVNPPFTLPTPAAVGIDDLTGIGGGGGIQPNWERVR